MGRLLPDLCVRASHGSLGSCSLSFSEASAFCLCGCEYIVVAWRPRGFLWQTPWAALPIFHPAILASSVCMRSHSTEPGQSKQNKSNSSSHSSPFPIPSADSFGPPLQISWQKKKLHSVKCENSTNHILCKILVTH